MRRIQFLMARLLQGALTIVLIAVVNFVLVHTAPGDPVTFLAGDNQDPAFAAQIRAQLGLDRPVLVQLGSYLGQLLQLDMGFSYRQNQPVLALIADRLPMTLLMSGSAFIAALLMGVGLGALSAKKVGTWVDSAVSLVALIFYATPVYWLSLMAVLVFSVQLGWLPGFGFKTVGANLNGLALVWDIARHLFLPALMMALFHMAVYARMTRTCMLEAAQMDFVKTAHAKGLSPGRIWRVHVLRNALLPVVTLAGLQAGALVGGSILIETVFAWPGIGRLLFDALMQRDYPLLLGTFLATTVMAVVFNLMTDIVYTLVDPRIEL